MVAEVKTLYPSNYRDIPACLSALSADVQANDVQGVATVCIRGGEVDVRGMGHLDAFQTYALLLAGVRHMEPILLDAMRTKR